MHGNAAGQGRQQKQQVEEVAEEIAKPGHAAEGTVENIGKRHKDQSGTGIRLHASREDGGKDDETGQDGHEGVDDTDIEG